MRIDRGRAGTSALPSQPVKPWMDHELLQARRAMLRAQRKKLETYQELRSVYRVMRDSKKATWKKEWLARVLDDRV